MSMILLVRSSHHDPYTVAEESAADHLSNAVFHASHVYTQVGGFMFGLFSKRRNLTVHDAGHIIERFLSNSLRYPQEWNDFVESKQRITETERVRLRCYQLDPLVNCPAEPAEAALGELRMMAASARVETYTDVATMLENFVDGTGGQWDWDDYISLLSYPDDPYLQGVQERMINLSNEFPSGGKSYCGEEGLEVIRDYVRDLRHRAAEYSPQMDVQAP
jgi:hypothetical protein